LNVEQEGEIIMQLPEHPTLLHVIEYEKEAALVEHHPHSNSHCVLTKGHRLGTLGYRFSSQYR
jgi:hypothetical protein